MNPDRFNEIFADLTHFEKLYPELSINNYQYYDIEKFNGTFGVNGSVVNGIIVIHVNKRSLNANVTSLLIIKFDIACLSETWVKGGDYLDHFLKLKKMIF